ncbi:hypothetical protein LTR62_002936 [Meristemomyces frigidus]|uniref:Uncharacterized protein n=1 Tax=Meristemomyces frigidus TaxID=1508187 RepID=A0AAN7TQP1_9PEZI|nr:hypothetical protein LTR62_002936 [Meristemomyces frigidus]
MDHLSSAGHPSRRPRRTGDYGMDNFSYDESHVSRFLMPQGLSERLPPNLREKTHDWQKAGAALCTTLDRIQESYETAREAAYPGNPRTFPRRTSFQAVMGAEPTPMHSPTCTSPPHAFPTLIPAPTLGKLTLSATATATAATAKQEIGMESPPYTPFDSFTSRTPTHGATTAQNTANHLPDLARLTHELSPLALTAPGQAFNEITWHHYTARFGEELHDCHEALQRVKGFSRMIEILLREMQGVLTPGVKLVFVEYRGWFEGVGVVVKELEERVARLECPGLEEVVGKRARGGPLMLEGEAATLL